MIIAEAVYEDVEPFDCEPWCSFLIGLDFAHLSDSSEFTLWRYCPQTITAKIYPILETA